MKRYRRVLSAYALAMTVLGFASLGRAEDAAEQRSAAFQAVEGAPGEQVPGGPLLVTAYAVVLALLVGYVARLALMQRRTDREVERLAHAVRSARGPGE